MPKLHILPQIYKNKGNPDSSDPAARLEINMDHYKRSARNTFSGLGLNRSPAPSSKLATWADAFATPDSVFVVVRGDEILFEANREEPLLLDGRMLTCCDHLNLEPVFLGNDGKRSFFSINADRLPAPLQHCLAGLGTFARLRLHLAALPRDMAAILGYARFAAGWQTEARFCSLCGHPTISKPSSMTQFCTNPDCGKEHFPRINPAMIVLVHHEDNDMCLLGRQASWTPRVYSALAGYVEPGESVEDAVVREVMEETGILVRDIIYHSSQPWPFSSSLMLGFFARAQNLEINLNDTELDDARWFPRADIERLLNAGELTLPPAETIARHLFDAWYSGEWP